MSLQQSREINNFNPLYIENETLKRKLDYLEGIVSSAERFESSRTIVDLKSFIKDVNIFSFINSIEIFCKSYKKIADLLDEFYRTKQGFEYEKLKCSFLEKKLMNQPEKKQDEENPHETKENEAKKQKIKELEEKVGSLTKEIDELKSKNEQFQKWVAKKDFFREYDFMCKEVILLKKALKLMKFINYNDFQVEGLRKQNYNLTEMIKKMQQDSEKPEENEEFSPTYN